MPNSHETITANEIKSDQPKILRLNKKGVTLSRIKRKILKHTWAIRGLIIAAILAGAYLGFLLFGQVIQKSGSGFYLGLAKDFIFTPETKIETFRDRTNILILGKGGEGHEAPDLTDTIMFASVGQSDVALISLPRDIWIPGLRTKLNSVYYWGNKKQPDGGIILAKASVEEIVGVPVHYAMVIDFTGFKKIIDILGGIEVDVETTFKDEKYPIPGRENDLCEGDSEYRCRYETLSFTQGRQVMDGETALKFVRSRNAEGDEGTDFARAARQQKVISAIKDKVLNRKILFSPRKLLELKKAVEDSSETDINSSTGAILARRFFSVRDTIDSHIMPEDLLERPPYSPMYDNLYVFIPKVEDPDDVTERSWSEVHTWVECILEKTENCI
jgi:LCP family protein required for cell wall assembly